MADLADLFPGFTYSGPETPVAVTEEHPAALPAGPGHPEPEAAPEAALSVAQQVLMVLRHALRVFRAQAKARKARDDSLFGEFCRSRQPSVDEQVEYAHGKSWVQPGYEDGFMDKAGTWYQRLIGIPGVGLGNAWIAFVKRGTRFAVGMTVFTVIATSLAVAWTATH